MSAEDRREAGIRLWASLGVREFEEYLAKQAAFAAYLSSHHPPV